MKKLLVSGFTAALVFGSLMTAPTASAAAEGVTCEAWITYSSPNKGHSKCTGMLWLVEKAQVKLTCIDPHGKQWNVYGKAMGNGETSTAICSSDRNVGIIKVGFNRVRL
ncbi:hypothetical protein R1T08_28065 [Streptomyces sp. SBC-4]|nr:hypothetical protein [Streptomyces sp. SBC-4]MDV5147922.1 hypothetical protein [Streptomyces sp. SBC-4]